MVIFPKTMLSWNIATSSDMNEESLSLFFKLEPKLDILVIGLDDEYPHDAPFLENIRDMFRREKIPLEILPTSHACSTFNFLNSEHRYAAAALIPPKVKYVEDILLNKGEESKKLEYGDESKTAVTERDEFYSDPLVPMQTSKWLQEEKELRKQEEAVAFKVRKPWKKEDTKEKAASIDGKKDKGDENP